MSYLSKNSKAIFAFLSLIIVSSNSYSYASDGVVRIFDCLGAVRFEQPISAESDLQIVVPGLSDGSEVELKSFVNGSVESTAVVSHGVVNFNNISSGEFVVCPSNGEVQKISLITNPAKSADSTLETVALAGGALGAVSAVAINAGGSSSGSSDLLGANSDVTETAAASNSKNKPSSRRPRAKESEDCFIGEDVVPLSPNS